MEEHRIFLEGLKLHGKGWKQIAMMIQSRTVVQIRTHAQKYFQKLAKAQQNGTLHGEGVTMDTRSGPAMSLAPAQDLATAKEKGSGGRADGEKQRGRGKAGRKKGGGGKRKISDTDAPGSPRGSKQQQQQQGSGKSMKITLKKVGKGKHALGSPSPNSVALADPYESELAFEDEDMGWGNVDDYHSSSGSEDSNPTDGSNDHDRNHDHHDDPHGVGVVGGVDEVDALLGVDGGDNALAWFDDHDDDTASLTSSFADPTRSLDGGSSSTGSDFDNENSNAGSDYGSNSSGSDNESHFYAGAKTAAASSTIPIPGPGARHSLLVDPPMSSAAAAAAAAAKSADAVSAAPYHLNQQMLAAARVAQQPAHNQHLVVGGNGGAASLGSLSSQAMYLYVQQQQRPMSPVQDDGENPFPQLEQSGQPHQQHQQGSSGGKGYMALQHIIQVQQQQQQQQQPVPSQQPHLTQAQHIDGGGGKSLMVQQHIIRTTQTQQSSMHQAPIMPSTARSRTEGSWYGKPQAHGQHPAKTGGSDAALDLMEPSDFETTFDEEDAFVSALLIPDAGGAEAF